jgi:hypothetical protein
MNELKICASNWSLDKGIQKVFLCNIELPIAVTSASRKWSVARENKK